MNTPLSRYAPSPPNAILRWQGGRTQWSGKAGTTGAHA